VAQFSTWIRIAIYSVIKGGDTIIKNLADVHATHIKGHIILSNVCVWKP
jgi:hypothetical protein